MFKRILIANRGEIACRIIKTARKMGIETVAVYSDADKDALHVEMADKAVLDRPAAGGAELSGHRQDRRRLQGDAAPRRCIRATAFCPSARPSPRRCEEAGIVFIGPNPKAIAAMGDKIESKKAAAAGQGLHRARPSRRHRRREGGGEDRQRHRLSGDDQGLRRRRRQGHAHRLVRAEVAEGFARSQVGGEVVVRRRPHVHREIHHRSAPHRNPGARRQARQRHLSRRARMLDPAPQPEGHRGGAVAAARRRDAQDDGRAGGRAGQGRRLRLAPARSNSSPARTRASSSWK